MIEVLNQMVEELLREDLSTREMESLAREVSNHEALVKVLRDQKKMDIHAISVRKLLLS